MPCDESMEIVFFIKVVPIVVPAAHVRARSWHSLALAERLEQAIFVEIEKQFVIATKVLQTILENYLLR